MMSAQQSLIDVSISAGGRATFTPRHYQITDHDNSFRLFDSGTTGVLSRAFTGAGKTLCTAMKIGTWLERGPRYRAMILIYEQQLVYQLQREVQEWLGKSPQIEMGELRVDYSDMPEIVIASRQSLIYWPEPTKAQREALAEFGITDIGSVAERHVKQYLKFLKAGKASAEDVRGEIARVSMEPEAHNGRWSRLHRFDWRYNWLVTMDEAHRYAMHLKSVGPLVEWFRQNPESRLSGITATPKRSDGVSIGDKLFPGIALDFPLSKLDEPCGVSEGWAVPYVQRYIQVESVDFRSIGRIGKDFDEADLERVLGKEETLSKLIKPMLDMVEDRQTLIFSPGVQMAKDVAEYINARSRCVCTCGEVKWYPTLLVGDGATCPHCGRLIEMGDVDKHPDQARELDGEIPHRDREAVYDDYAANKFQFLSVCGLAKEGYDNPEVSCVAVFRPVSRAASSLAEQMKGRSCRPLRGLLDEWPHKYQADIRLEAIRTSRKPNALIVDLVGITGLADCASTIQIYSEGLPDNIAKRAEEVLLSKGSTETADVGEAIAQAKREDAEARAKAKSEREAAAVKRRELAERRAKAGAEVDYSVHESGVSPQVSSSREATEKQYRMAAFLGMDIQNVDLTKKQLGRIISQLQAKVPLEEIARTNRLDEGRWQAVGPTAKQKWALQGLGADWVKTRADASLVLDAKLSPANFFARMRTAVANCQTPDALTNIARDIGRVNRTVRLDSVEYAGLIQAGRTKRSQLTPTEF